MALLNNYMGEEQKKESKLLWADIGPDKPNHDLILWIKIIGLGIFLFASGIIITNQFGWLDNSSAIDETLSDSSLTSADENSSEQNCNTTGINLHGEIVTYISPADYDTEGDITIDQTASESVVYTINEANKDDKIKAIILEVDSFGGQAVAGEEIAAALKSSKKPTVAFIRTAGASAAYWAATGASRIFASKNSDVGSIGVTMSYLDFSKQNIERGLTYNQLSSGKFKDTGDSDKALTDEEKKLIMRDINIVNHNFIKAVSDNRKVGIEKVASLADGSTMMGEMALKNGLIDVIGGYQDVKDYIKGEIGEDLVICW